MKLKRTNRLKTTVYAGAPIVRVHSPRIRAREIYDHFKSTEFTRVIFIGKPGTGKTTAIDNVIHLLHQSFDKEKEMYSITRLKETDLLKFGEIVDSLGAGNHIIAFDDVSYVSEIMSRVDKALLKLRMVTTRHAGKDGTIKIILFMNIHYTKALDKMMRDADFLAFTTIGAEERRSVIELGISKKMVQTFQARQSWLTTKKFLVIPNVAMKMQRLIYHFRKPFAIVLWKGVSTGMMVYSHPKHDKKGDITCRICSPNQKEYAPADKLIDYLDTLDSPRNYGYILRMAMWQQGFKKALRPAEKNILDVFNAACLRYHIDFDELLMHLEKNRSKQRIERIGADEHRERIKFKHIENFDKNFKN